VRAFRLKAAATLFTLATAAASATFVAAHLKNIAAPLQPTVVDALPSVTQVSASGRLSLSPRVQTGSMQAITSTHAS